MMEIAGDDEQAFTYSTALLGTQLYVHIYLRTYCLYH